jgi:hypothetical protein
MAKKQCGGQNACDLASNAIFDMFDNYPILNALLAILGLIFALVGVFIGGLPGAILGVISAIIGLLAYFLGNGAIYDHFGEGADPACLGCMFGCKGGFATGLTGSAVAGGGIFAGVLAAILAYVKNAGPWGALIGGIIVGGGYLLPTNPFPDPARPPRGGLMGGGGYAL